MRVFYILLALKMSSYNMRCWVDCNYLNNVIGSWKRDGEGRSIISHIRRTLSLRLTEEETGLFILTAPATRCQDLRCICIYNPFYAAYAQTGSALKHSFTPYLEDFQPNQIKGQFTSVPSIERLITLGDTWKQAPGNIHNKVLCWNFDRKT